MAGDKVELQQVITMWGGVSMIVNNIVGSGIFITPRSVLLNAGSPAAALAVWVVAGLANVLGAMCYAELAIMIPESGAEFSYIKEAFGPLPAFLFVWVNVFLQDVASRSAVAMTFGTYICEIFWPCVDPSGNKALAVQFTAMTATVLLTSINCYRVKKLVKIVEMFSIIKLTSVIILIISGIFYLSYYSIPIDVNWLENSSTSPGSYAHAFYSAYWTFAGSLIISQVIEEVSEPRHVNVPMSITIGLGLVCCIYLAVNCVYFLVLSPEEILASSAVATTFGAKISSVLALIIPAFVSISSLGMVNGHVMASSRLILVASRARLLPSVFSLINVEQITPVPAIILTGSISTIFISTNSIDSLIVYTTYANILGSFAAVLALIYMRLTRNNLFRPLKLPLLIPIIYIGFFAIILVLPFLRPKQSLESGISIAIILTGIPVYFTFIWWKNKPKIFQQIDQRVTNFFQKLFNALPETFDAIEDSKTQTQLY